MSKEKHYDKDSSYTGRTDDHGNYEKHYDKHSSYTGRTDKETGKHYDKDGYYTGRTDEGSGSGGGGDSSCFITTACIEAKGLSENCPELNVLRTFRDEYIENLPEGEKAIREYYEIAPQIVAGINSAENPKKVYLDLYERLVSKSLELIHFGEKDEAFKNGMEIYNELKQRYLNKNK